MNTRHDFYYAFDELIRASGMSDFDGTLLLRAILANEYSDTEFANDLLSDENEASARALFTIWKMFHTGFYLEELENGE